MKISHVAGLHVGSVETCSPTEVKILLDVDAPQDMAFNTGQPQGFPRLNGYVLVPNEGGSVVAVIARMTMEPAPQGEISRERGGITIPLARRRLFVTPLGTLETRRTGGDQGTEYQLRRGVASYPAVGDAVVLPTADQLRAIVEASGVDRRVLIGSSRLALDAPVTIDPDKLFGRHIGVFGNTGSGKSCTVAGLLRWSIDAAGVDRAEVNARFIVLDPNGEYRTCFNDLENIDVKVFSVEPDEREVRLTVPAWMWNGQEWSGVLDASPGTQRPVLMQAIRQLRGAVLAGSASPAETPAAKLLLATQVRAFTEWLQGWRAEGVAALSNFLKFRSIHDNLRALEGQFATFAQTLGDDDANLSTVLDAAAETSRQVRARRTETYNNQDRIQQIHDADLIEVITQLMAVKECLPDAGVGDGPSEDTPARFDPAGLPGMIELVGSITPGNLQQHMAGLNLRIRTLLADGRITPIIAPDDGGEGLADWLRGLLGAGEGGRGQITVLDLSLVPSDVLTTVVAVLGRLVFETAQRYRRIHRATMPTVLVLEEAHNFVQRQGSDADETASSVRCRHVFEKIAKEGRKFGVGLVLSSQRPAELSPTIVAQCNSFILHRIVNDRDQELVCKLAPDSSGTLLKELPSLPTQKAILLGIASEIPLVFEVRPLAEVHRPSSANPDFWGVWTGARALSTDIDAVASAWTS